MSLRLRQWFQPGDGIAREVITADIQRYLGSDALVRPGQDIGEYEDVQGYWITAYRTLTSLMVQDLKLDSQRWKAEAAQGQVMYQDSRTHQSRQNYGPSTQAPVPGELPSYPPPLLHSYPQPSYVYHSPTIENQQYPITEPRLDYPQPKDTYYRRTPMGCRQPPLYENNSSMLPGGSFYTPPKITRTGELESGYFSGRTYATYGEDIYGAASKSSRPQESPPPPPSSSPPKRRKGYNRLPSPPAPTFLGNIVRPESRPESPPVSSFLVNPFVQEAESSEIEQSVISLAQNRAHLSQSAEDLAYKCGWQIGRIKFLGNGNVGTTLEPTGRCHLGSGSIGQVDEVRNPVGNFESFVRKKISISRNRSLARRELKLVEDEIDHMKALVHPHIVKIIGSYQEGSGTRDHSYCLLMYPVGDSDLAIFLEDACSCIQQYRNSQKAIRLSMWIKKWFGCLASALSYMHTERIHHEDIKPKNIVHQEDRIYFTDFSSSRQFEAGQATSTANPARASRLFAAPEALIGDNGDISRHGSRTDVFSLGLSFVEMLSVLVAQDIESLHEYLDKNSDFGESLEHRQYHRVLNHFSEWFPAGIGREMYTLCIEPMLKLERSERPSAEEVVVNIREHQPWQRTLACPCQDT